MLTTLLRYWNSSPLAQARRRCLPARLLAHVPAGGHVLDVGSGDGYLAKLLHEAGGAASVQGVEVLPRPDCLVPTRHFDGETLPFDANSFDLVTLIDVLHHCERPENLLHQAARVSRGRIVIKDHYWCSRLDRWILCFSDYLGNKPYNVALPYNFLRLEQWAELFDTLALRVVSCECFRYGWMDRSKQVVFVVEALTAPAAERSAPPDAPPAR